MMSKTNTVEPEQLNVNEAEVRYITPDNSRITGKDRIVKKGMLSTSYRWERQDHSIAMSMTTGKMRGVLSKNIIISPNEMAVIVKDGNVFDVVENGKLKVGGMLVSKNLKDVDVIMMDISPKDTNWNIGELWTEDQQKVSAKGLLRYRIVDSKKFFSMIYAYSTFDRNGERFLTVEDINKKIKSEVLTRVLQPEASRVNVEDIYGNVELQLRIENQLDIQLRQTLDMWGLELLTLTVEWDLGNYIELAKARRTFEKEEEIKEIDTLAKEGDREREGRVEIAGVRSLNAATNEILEFRRQQKVKDVETDILIDRKESDSDFEDAKQGIETYKQWKKVKNEVNNSRSDIERETHIEET